MVSDKSTTFQRKTEIKKISSMMKITSMILYYTPLTEKPPEILEFELQSKRFIKWPFCPGIKPVPSEGPTLNSIIKTYYYQKPAVILSNDLISLSITYATLWKFC